jgi:hypothetical protein
MTELGRRILKAARIGMLAGLCIAVVYAVLGAVGTTEMSKSLGFSLLLLGFPTLFAVVPLLQWLGLQGGTSEGIAVLLLTLSANGALWGAVVGAVVGAWRLGRIPRE